jgi:hypothetical protein
VELGEGQQRPRNGQRGGLLEHDLFLGHNVELGDGPRVLVLAASRAAATFSNMAS